MRFLVLVLTLSLCAACSSMQGFTVDVSSLAVPEFSLEKKTVSVLPGNDADAPESLQFLEYKAIVESAFRRKGFAIASNGTTPEIAVFVEYGIGDPQTKVRNYSIPVFGQTGVSSSYTTGSANTTMSSYGGYGSANTSYSETTTYTPTYGITGYNSGTTSYDVYTRYISLDGFFTKDWYESEQLVPAFSTAIVSTGSSGDLRRVFPVMMGAATEHLGTNTKEAKRELIHEADERVEALIEPE